MSESKHTPESKLHAGDFLRKLAEWADAMHDADVVLNETIRKASYFETLISALREGEYAAEQLCQGQDPANECWAVLGRIRAAIAKAEGR